MFALVVEQVDDGFGHGRPPVLGQRPDLDIAVVVQAAQFDIRERDFRLIMRQMDRIELGAAILSEAIEPVIDGLLRHV